MIDRKTVGRTSKTPALDWRMQAGIYQLEKGRWLPHEWHLSVKTKEPKIVTPNQEPGLVLKPSSLVRHQVTMQLEHVVKQIAWCYSTFGPDEAWPGAILHDWRCNFCGWRDVCSWWNRPADLARRKA